MGISRGAAAGRGHDGIPPSGEANQQVGARACPRARFLPIWPASPSRHPHDNRGPQRPRETCPHRRLVGRRRGGRRSVAILAWSRGESVSALWMVIAAACVFAIAYRFHSAWLMAKVLTIDELRATPSETCSDGKDFVRTNRWVVFGHHFAAIAGPGPLVGPVLAAQFGYLPGFLWILIGAVFGGRRARQHRPFLLGPAPRQVARPDGQRRGRPVRGPGGAGQHHRDLGDPPRRAGARGRECPRRIAVGTLHDCGDDADRAR